MKAVILAAGMGTRLRPETYKIPKCLVNVTERPILYYQLKALEQARIDKVIIVGGYLISEIYKFLKNAEFNIPIEVIENKLYDKTNNMYSLNLALDKLDSESGLNDDLIICNGDVIFEENLISENLTGVRGNVIFVDRSQYLQESMKVAVNREGEVINISKMISPSDYFGVSIDLYRFDSNAIKEIKKIIENFISIGETNLWTEVAIQRAVQNDVIHIYAKDITGYIWWEIDTFSDVKRAEHRIKLLNNVKSILDKKVYAFDLDGTVIRGNIPIVGATEFLNFSRSLGKTVSFITNNSSMNNEKHRERIEKILNIQIGLEMIYSSLDYLKEFLQRDRVHKIFPILNTEAMNYLVKSFILDEEKPELVIIGFDTEVTYAKLKKACLLIENNVPFMIVNPDIKCPVSDGFIPDSGSFGELVENVTNRKPCCIGGKPNPDIIKKMAERYSCSPADICYFGDRLYTDIKMAEQAGAMAVLMLTGETTLETLDSSGDAKRLLLTDNVFLGENYIFLRSIFSRFKAFVTTNKENG